MALKEIFKQIFETERSISVLRNRATGRTTRLADEYIQKLFKSPEEWITVYDHWPEKRAAARLVDIIRKRLDYEHRQEIYVRSIENGFSIKLKNYKQIDVTREINELEEKIAQLRKNMSDLFL